MPGSSINTVERVVSAFPQPKKKTAAMLKKEKEAEEAAKVAALERAKIFGEPVKTALDSAISWNNI